MFGSAINKLQERFQSFKDVGLSENEPLKSNHGKVPNVNRLNAILSAIRNLNGMDVIEVTPCSKDKGMDVIVCIKRQCKVSVHLDAHNQLKSFKVLEKEFLWLESTTALQESLTFIAPSDLRYLIQYLAHAMDGRDLLKQDIAALKKCLVVMAHDPLHLQISFMASSGLLFTVQLHACYGKMPGGVYIVSMTHHDPIFSKEEVEGMRVAANAQCFSKLGQLHSFLMMQLEERMNKLKQ